MSHTNVFAVGFTSPPYIYLNATNPRIDHDKKKIYIKIIIIPYFSFYFIFKNFFLHPTYMFICVCIAMYTLKHYYMYVWCVASVIYVGIFRRVFFFLILILIFI